MTRTVLFDSPFLLGFAQDSSALIAGTMKGCRILRAVPYHPAP
jgi:hypothetical protein